MSNKKFKKDIEWNQMGLKGWFKFIKKKLKPVWVIGSSVFSVVLVFIILIALGVHSDNVEKRQSLEDIQSKKISSCTLTTDSSNSEQFVLGVANLSKSYANVEYYFYMQGNVGYSLEHLSASNVEIVATDTVEPHIEGHFDSRGKLVYTMDVILEADKDYMYEMTHYIMYVPSDYITEEYIQKTEVTNK